MHPDPPPPEKGDQRLSRLPTLFKPAGDFNFYWNPCLKTQPAFLAPCRPDTPPGETSLASDEEQGEMVRVRKCTLLSFLCWYFFANKNSKWKIALQQQRKEHLAMRNLGGKANLNNVIEGKNTKLQHSSHLVNTVGWSIFEVQQITSSYFLHLIYFGKTCFFPLSSWRWV